MRARTLLSARQGFTLIEMLIAASLLAVLLTSSLGFLLRSQRTMNVVGTRHDLETNFDDLLKLANQEFGRRYNPLVGENPAFQILPPQAGQPGNCNGLVIRQRFPITGNDLNVRVVRVLTTCHGGNLPGLPPTFLTAYAANCGANSVPWVTYSRWDSEASYNSNLAPVVKRTYPQFRATAAMALCFATDPTGVVVEGGGGSLDGNNQAYVFQKRINFRSDDKNKNVEVLQ